MAVVLLFLLRLAVTSEADPNYLNTICSNTTTFKPNSTYQSNLNLLLSSLVSNSTSNNGFHNTTTGQTPDTVYGLFLCRGDLSTDVCRDCVTVATQDIVQRCPVEKVALIFYDECLLRYSSRTFFNSFNEGYMLPLSNLQNATNQTGFSELVRSTMNGLATQASSSARKFATGATTLSSFTTLYTLAQCTQDLSSSNCQRCLEVSIGNLQTGRIGSRIVGPSCNVRFETYRFYNRSAAPASPPPPPPLTLPPPARKGEISTVTIVAIVALIVVSLVLFYCILSRRVRKKYSSTQEDDVGDDIPTMTSLQFDFASIEAATRKFSDYNKLGEGGFGEVYKGTLPNGQDIAVKRLSKSSGQGAEEFKNEVVLVAKLQHRNLVKLLGFCLEREEKILVYEFVPNKSLDYFLYDPEKQSQLDWSMRNKIIGGIARGILYLHEDSRLRIIHRDLKASNILLDGDMNPKISDFGMARIFGVDQTQGNTSRIVGTYGYISPEYAMHGQFSAKSDVYSFGVLVLEIITGKKNNSFHQSDDAENLASYVWKHWREGTPLKLLDPTLTYSYSRTEVMRCIHIGLLCVQEDPAERPTMATIVLMLNSYSVSLPSPQQPAFSQSTAEAEYISTTSESNQGATVIYCDNKYAIFIAKNPTHHGKTKHIKVKYHAIREAEKSGETQLVHCSSEEQVADLLTKALPRRSLIYQLLYLTVRLTSVRVYGARSQGIRSDSLRFISTQLSEGGQNKRSNEAQDQNKISEPTSDKSKPGTERSPQLNRDLISSKLENLECFKAFKRDQEDKKKRSMLSGFSITKTKESLVIIMVDFNVFVFDHTLLRKHVVVRLGNPSISLDNLPCWLSGYSYNGEIYSKTNIQRRFGFGLLLRTRPPQEIHYNPRANALLDLLFGCAHIDFHKSGQSTLPT
ncbi:cysteine-rich receptor-like protein kinase 10 [Tripterygium wilfordii]|uniref:cysteine-rich receptor-like protein kinase 10 n=1 Tax=Tripterygium wilfordii TaxID=458696 RepID=UPI0018F7EE25|nr:cysteine-rich receptor-like protein kinase 10 [Tripterygium wilfordii]